MGKIKNTRVLASDPETTSAPRFNFRQYRVGDVYHNDGNDIDFVTDNKSLYVCLVESVQASKENIAEQEGLLKLVSQGEQGVPGANGSNGIPGVTPRIDAHFDGKQMIVTVNGAIKAVSPDLGGPSWKPVVEGTTLSWELTTDRYSPAPIDLTTLRPISEHPILLRTNSDNTKYDWETSGPANYIQWKYEGDEYWNNLISISELMNLALAGVSFWYNEDTQEWHFGHKEVIRASYTADKNGRKIISDVELGDILFDAGAVPMPDYELEVQEMQEAIEQIQTELENYATKEWVEGKGYITGVDLDDYAKKSEIPSLADAYTKAESDAKYQPKGSYLTAVKTLGGASLEGSGSLPLATINGESLFSNKNYTIPSTDTFATKAELSDYVKSVNNVRPDSTGNVTISVGNLSFDLVTRTVGGKRHLIKISNGVETDLGEFTNGSGESGTGSFDVKIQDNYLYKSTDNGVTWTSVGQVNGGGEGCAKCWDEAEIKSLISNNAEVKIENGKLYQKHNGSWSEVGSVSGGTVTGCDECFTTAQIQQMIADALDDFDPGTGSNVSVNIIQATGNAIADIIIDGTTYHLFAPDVTVPSQDERYRLFTVYQRTSSRTTAPSISDLSTAYWNIDEDSLNLGSSNWSNHPENASGDNKYIWMTSATFKFSTQSRIGDWANPICLTGEPGSNGIAGDDGADGSGVEFIYTLIPDESYVSFVSTPVAPAGQGDDDIPSGWTDHPQGIGEYAPKDIETTVSIPDELTPMMWKVEMASVRIYDGASKTWGAYSKPFIWSMWGEDGMDGDGVEYIFCVTTDPSIGAFIAEIPITDEQVRQLGDDYQVPDWTPYNGNWTDNPLDVDENQPYEWVAIRKYNGETGKWGPFSDPKVWGLWGQKTVYVGGEVHYRRYMCYAFTRTDIVNFAKNYTVVSPWEYRGITYAQWIAEADERESNFYDNPLDYIYTLVKSSNGEYTDSRGTKWTVATGNAAVTWYDTVPDGTDQLYIINNLIGDERQNETGWNGPVKWGDQAGFQVEYAASTEDTDKVFAGIIPLPSLNGFKDDSDETINETAWRAAALSEGCGEWCDDDQISDPVYMATAYKKANGVWSAWNVAKIKGEKGNDGTDGTDGADGAGVEFVYFRTADESQVPAVSDTYGTYDKQTKVSEDPEVDDFLPLVVASGFTPEDDTLTINNEFYWHDNPEGVNSTLQCEWVAVRFSAISGSGKRVWGPFSVALWSKYGVNGKDGDGIEYVFHTSTSGTTAPTLNNAQGKCPKRDGTGTYELSTDYANRREWLPYAASGTPSSINDDFWTDDPTGVSASAPYEWVAVRKYNGELKEWEQFGPAALWAKFSFDGRDSDTREYVYLLSSTKPSIFGKLNAAGTALVDASGQSSATVNEVSEFKTDDYFPYAVVNGTRWEDHPTGVDTDHKIEWYSFRDITREKVNNEDVITYGDFCSPMIWSEYGKDGRDGDGVQYIFTRTELYPFANQKDNPSQWDTTTAAYQSKYDEFLGPQSPYDWTDDPSGPTQALPYEWVSMRRWRVTSENDPGSWSAYSEPSLWACYVEDSGNRTIVTLDISNSQAPFQVDENNKVVKGTDAIPFFAGTSSVLIKDDGTLLDWGKVYLGTLNNGVVTWNSTPAITISNYTATVNRNVSVTNGSATSSIDWAYASQRRAYDFTLSTVFASNATVTEPVVIPVKVEDITGAYAGVDYLYLNPVHSEKLVTLNKEVGDVIKKASAESKLYDPNTIWFAGDVENDTTYDTVSKFTYSYTIDDGTRIEFDAIPTSDKNSVISTGEKYYYFDKNGNRLANANAGFATLYIYNDDDNQHEWNDWSARMQLNLEYDNTLTAITDKLILGVGYDGEITDEEPVYIIYPGKDGDVVTDTYQHHYFSATELSETELNQLAESSWISGGTYTIDDSVKGKYVYIRTTVVYSRTGSIVTYTVQYIPEDGTDGASGTAIPYTYRGEWTANTDYYSNSQRVDIVKYNNKYYICKTTHKSGQTFVSSNWEEFEGEYENIATGFLFAETGVIQNLKVAELATQGGDNGERLTINAGGSTGSGNNALLGYSGNSETPGIVISGTELSGVFTAASVNQYLSATGKLLYKLDDEDSISDWREGITSGNIIPLNVSITGLSSTNSIISVKNVPTLTWTVYNQDSEIFNDTNVNTIVDDYRENLMLPSMRLSLIYQDSTNTYQEKVLATWEWLASVDNATYQTPNISAPISLDPNKSYQLALIPSDFIIIGGLDTIHVNGQQLASIDSYYEISITNPSITYDLGRGNGLVGVTIAPNGILVYFNNNNYLEFINTGSGYLANWVVNGSHKI